MLYWLLLLRGLLLISSVTATAAYTVALRVRPASAIVSGGASSRVSGSVIVLRFTSIRVLRIVVVVGRAVVLPRLVRLRHAVLDYR